MRTIQSLFFIVILSFFSTQVCGQLLIDEQGNPEWIGLKKVSVAMIPTVVFNQGFAFEGQFNYNARKYAVLQFIFIDPGELMNSRINDEFRKPYQGFALNANHRWFMQDYNLDQRRVYVETGLHFSNINFSGLEYKWIPYEPDPTYLTLELVDKKAPISRYGFNFLLGLESRFNNFIYLDFFGGFIYRNVINPQGLEKVVNTNEIPNGAFGFAFDGFNFTCGLKIGIYIL
jgi:hypothetical protein